MRQSLSDIDLVTLIDVEPLLQSESIFKLPENLEADYQAYKNRRLLEFRRMALLFAVVMTCILSLCEIFIYQDKWGDLAVLAYGLAVPYFLFSAILVGSKFFAKNQDIIIVQLGVVCGVILSVVLFYDKSLVVKYAINSYILLLVFICGVLQLSLSRSLSVIIPTLVCFNICVLLMGMHTLQWVALYNLMYIGVGLMVIYFNYQHSVARRKQFLQMMVINNERQKARAIKEKLRTMSSTDRLTGVANRQALDQTLYAEWRRLCRSANDLSIMVIGVDDFRQYNDQCGHKQGDVALIDIAQCVQNAFKRATDTVGRYQGDTFMVILPETAKGEAELMCRSVCKRVRELPQPNGLPSLTVSIGVASCKPDPKQSFEDVVTQAISALKEAKSNGQDQYCVARMPSF